MHDSTRARLRRFGRGHFLSFRPLTRSADRPARAGDARCRLPKTEKVEKVKELTQRFKGSQGAMFADFRGLTVKDATELRKGLRAADADFAVVKNTLTRIAAREAGLEGALGLLEGPTAIAFIAGDAVGGAKAALELARRFPALVVKGPTPTA